MAPLVRGLGGLFDLVGVAGLDGTHLKGVISGKALHGDKSELVISAKLLHLGGDRDEAQVLDADMQLLLDVGNVCLGCWQLLLALVLEAIANRVDGVDDSESVLTLLDHFLLPMAAIARGGLEEEGGMEVGELEEGGGELGDVASRDKGGVEVSELGSGVVEEGSDFDLDSTMHAVEKKGGKVPSKGLAHHVEGASVVAMAEGSESALALSLRFGGGCRGRRGPQCSGIVRQGDQRLGNVGVTLLASPR